MLLRWIAVALYLCVKKRESYGCCGYCALLFINILFAIQMVMQWIIVNVLAVTNEVISRTLFWGLMFTIFTVIEKIIPFEKINRIYFFQLCVELVISIIVAFGKENVRTLTSMKRTPLASVIYPLLISCFSLCVIAFFDTFLVMLQEQRRKELMDGIRESQYESMKAQLEAIEDVRRVYHDMKNHLKVIERFSGSEDQRRYIQSVMQELDNYRELVKTGNETVDALLFSKRAEFRSNHICLSVNLDLSMLTYLKPVDAVAIFGNAIDNALEAAAKVSQMERRYVGIRNWQFANFVVIHFSNSVEVKVEQTNTGLKSTKSGKHHGIGMSSIQRSISKYGGEISYSCTEDEFVLKIILPVNVTVEMQD